MTPSYLTTLYTDEQDCLHQLGQLLEQETHTLQQRDLDRLDEITAEKQSLLSRLETLDLKRRSLLEKHRNQINQDKTLLEIVKRYDDSLKNSLLEFQQANRINQGIVELGRIFTRQILNLLRNPTETDSKLYDTDGNAGKSSLSSSLAKV